MLGATVLVVTFVAVAVLVLSILSERYAAEQIDQEVDEARQSFFMQMELMVRSWRRETEVLARSPYLLATAAIPDVDEATLELALDNLQAPVIALTCSDGKVLASRGGWATGTDLTQEPGFRSAVTGGVESHVWRHPNGLAIVAVAPLVQGNELLGSLVRGRLVDAALAERIGALAGRDVVLLHEGEQLGRCSQSLVHREAYIEELQKLRHGGLPAAGVTVTFHADGIDYGGLALRLHPDNGIAYMSYDLDAVETVREQARMWLFAAGILLILGGVAFAARTASRLSQPLHALTKASDRLRNGDLTARVDAAPMDQEFGGVARSFNAMADTTQQLVADVRDKATRAEAANRAKDAFLTSISHELRTPLTGIQSTAELLQQYGDETSVEERSEFLATILREADRLGQRIGDALDYAALAGDGAKWTMGRVDLQQVCEQACRRLTSLQDLKAVHVQIECCPDAVLQGDREHITQAVYHLVQNAWTWSPPNGVVDVIVAAVAGGFTVEVADKGPGITPDERARIFETFSQGGDVLVDKPAGIGIGLKIAAEVAHMHGGSIEYSDRTNGGARFHLLLRTQDRAIDRIAAIATADLDGYLTG